MTELIYIVVRFLCSGKESGQKENPRPELRSLIISKHNTKSGITRFARTNSALKLCCVTMIAHFVKAGLKLFPHPLRAGEAL